VFTHHPEHENTVTNDSRFRTERTRNTPGRKPGNTKCKVTNSVFEPGRKPGRSKAMYLDKEENLEVVRMFLESGRMLVSTRISQAIYVWSV
jgi:hypothetical protein